MASKRRAPALMSVEEVIDRVRAQGDAVPGAGFEKPRSIAADNVASMKLPTGEALPADLAAWLRYDGKWLGLFKKDGTWRARPLRKLLAKWLRKMSESEDDDVEEELEEIVEMTGNDVLAYWLSVLPEPGLADALAVQIPNVGDQEHLLILEPGRSSLRVLGCHKRLEFWWKYDSLAAYLGHQLGFVEQA